MCCMHHAVHTHTVCAVHTIQYKMCVLYVPYSTYIHVCVCVCTYIRMCATYMYHTVHVCDVRYIFTYHIVHACVCVW